MIERVLVLSLCVRIHWDSKSHPPVPISLHTVYDAFFCVFVLVYPDGELSVDSLSPAHTLSSVPSPSSVEALSPYSLQVSHCFQLFVLLSFGQLTCISNANFTIAIGCEYLHMWPSWGAVFIQMVSKH